MRAPEFKKNIRIDKIILMLYYIFGVRLKGIAPRKTKRKSRVTANLSLERAPDPKVAGPHPAPATKLIHPLFGEDRGLSGDAF